MPATQLGAMPANQLNSLPLYTAASAAAGGTITLSPGGGVSRFWDATALGISGSAFAADANAFLFLATTFISTFGCTKFAFILTRTNAAAGLAIASISPFIQYRLSATDTAPTSLGATQNLNNCGTISLENVAFAYPAMQAGGEVQRNASGFSADIIINGANPTGTTAMIGDQVRLLFTVGAAPAAGNVFSCYLWGTS